METPTTRKKWNEIPVFNRWTFIPHFKNTNKCLLWKGSVIGCEADKRCKGKQGISGSPAELVVTTGPSRIWGGRTEEQHPSILFLEVLESKSPMVNILWIKDSRLTRFPMYSYIWHHGSAAVFVCFRRFCISRSGPPQWKDLYTPVVTVGLLKRVLNWHNGGSEVERLGGHKVDVDLWGSETNVFHRVPRLAEALGGGRTLPR